MNRLFFCTETCSLKHFHNFAASVPMEAKILMRMLNTCCDAKKKKKIQ